jgi:hypothetical protein
VIDNGAWDALGEQGKTDYFSDIATRNPVPRIASVADIAQSVLFAMINTFLTGRTLHIDGGEPLSLSSDLRALPLSKASRSSTGPSQMGSGAGNTERAGEDVDLVVSVMPCPHFGGPKRGELR